MILLIDSGHGGFIAGQYQTLGKKFTFADGTTIYEGEFNRAIKARILELLHQQGIPFIDLVPEQKDISLKERVQRANAYHQQYKGKTLFFSIHADAGGGSGSGVFVARKCSKKSLVMAATAQQSFLKHFPESRFRGIKPKDFYVLKYTHMPAILLENFFMDNETECKRYLLTKKGRDRIAAYLVDLMIQITKSNSYV